MTMPAPHAAELLGPISRIYISQRLKLHYLDWGNEEKPLLLLVHGGRDHARSWDWVASELRTHFHVIAPDLRGHGDSEWAVGSIYSLIDYVLDAAQLLKVVDRFPVHVIGHSLGGSIALHYTGIYPDRVAKVIAIEGLGPSPEMIASFEDTPAAERMLHWVREMQSLGRRRPHHYATLDEAVQRMREANPRLTDEQARHLTVHGAQREEDGSYRWKFDNFTRAVSPYLFNVTDARNIWGRITCPTLLVRGTESWASDPLRDGRAEAFRAARVVNVEGAGHWVHHDQLAVFLRLAREFLGV
jgi:pimeloyl-ACP methyl ester carboxylesterase